MISTSLLPYYGSATNSSTAADRDGSLSTSRTLFPSDDLVVGTVVAGEPPPPMARPTREAFETRDNGSVTYVLR